MVFLNLAAGMPAGSNGSGQRGRRAEAPADLFSKEKGEKRKMKEEYLRKSDPDIMRPESRLPAEGFVRRPRASAVKSYEIRVYKVNVFSKISENFSFYPLRPHAARLRRKTGPSEAGREAIRAGPEERGRGTEQDFYELSIRRNIRVVQLIQFRKISDGLLPEQAFPEAEQPQRSTA